MDWEGKDPNYEIITSNNFVDYDFFKTFETPIIEGRAFSNEITSDTSWTFIINEEMQKAMGIGNPIGKRFVYWQNSGTIIGVVKDFHYQTFLQKLGPLVLMCRPGEVNVAYVRVNPAGIDESIQVIENTWNKINPNYPFEYSFMDERIERSFRSISSFGNLVSAFSFFAILIACLGSFGLASYMAERKTKEIGIRKVLGASSKSIVGLLTKEFIFLVLISNIIAAPIIYLIMNKWLEKFAYKTTISIDLFVLGIMMSILLILVTVGFQSIKAANTNPVNTLRSE